MLYDSESGSYYIEHNSSLIIDDTKIDVTMNNNIVYKFQNVSVVSIVKDVIKIKYYRKLDNKLYFVNVPVMICHVPRMICRPTSAVVTRVTTGDIGRSTAVVTRVTTSLQD